MNLVFSDHVKKRMRQRGIEKWEVEHILKYPLYVRKSFEGKKEAVGEMRNRKIKIVFIEVDKYIRVITVI